MKVKKKPINDYRFNKNRIQKFCTEAEVKYPEDSCCLLQLSNVRMSD
jgi:hypothetical protein